MQGVASRDEQEIVAACCRGEQAAWDWVLNRLRLAIGRLTCKEYHCPGLADEVLSRCYRWRRWRVATAAGSARCSKG